MALNKSMVGRIKASLSPQATPISNKQDGFNMLNRTGSFGVANSNQPKRQSAGPQIQPTNTARSGKGSINAKHPARKQATLGNPPTTNQERNSKGGGTGASLPKSKGGANMKGVD